MGFNSLPRPQIHQESESKLREQLRDRIFDQLVAGKVLDTFLDELHEHDLDTEDIEDITRAFGMLSEKDKRTILSIPAQLRPRLLGRYAEQIKNDTLDSLGMFSDIISKSEKAGYTLGFHLSPHDIRPEKDGSWMIRGTEKDHRHDDLPMAYYSMDYAHRYLKKPSRFLYVIRAETGEKSSHYPDNDGTWGHASSLAIVEKIDMQSLEKELDDKFKASELPKAA